MDLGERIRGLRRTAALTQGELATRAGVAQQLISDLENGKVRTTRRLVEIATALGVDIGALDPRFASAQSTGQHFGALPAPAETPIMPVYAAAEGGQGNILVSYDALEYVRRPHSLELVSDAYGILIVGESMAPAFEPGDTALINPRLPYIRDVDVVMYATGGEERATIKRLRGWTREEWSLEQWNPPRTFKLSRHEWTKCHRVVGKLSRR